MSATESGDRQIRNLRLRYIFALGLVALLSISIYGLTRSVLRSSENDAYVVNIAGRQRMLSQQITKETLLLLQEHDRVDRASATILEAQLDLFEGSHFGLLGRDPEMGLQGQNSEAVRELFSRIETSFQSLISSARSIRSAAIEGRIDEAVIEELAGNLLEAEKAFLPIMNSIVFQYDEESKARVDQNISYETFMLVVVLAVLLIEVLFIFQPAVRRLRDYFDRLQTSERERATITEELSRRNEELKEALVQAEESTRMKTDFLATMSHEIRTPMNATVGMTTLLLDTELTPQQTEFAETIRNSSDALLVIINDILDFSKIESGKLVLDEHVFNLRDSIESALGLFRVQASQRKLDLTYIMDEDVPESVESDSGRLRQILVNLIGNAVKFTETGGVTVRVSKEASEREGENCIRLKFSIEDTGIGIPESKLDKLFTPFSQVDASTTRRYGGTGLGLSISHLLSEVMGGSISVESEEGKGSVFTFYIEVVAARSMTKLPLNEVQTDMEESRVLIVDDNEANRQLLEQVISRWGMTALPFENPAETIEAIENGLVFDVGVLDYHMPGMSGADLARRIHEMIPDTPPLVALTSLGMLDDGERELFAKTFAKPLRPGLLLDSFWSLLAPRRKREEEQKETKKDEIDPTFGVNFPLKILIADDNAVNLRVSSLMLKRMGYEPDTVVDGHEVIQVLEKKQYDVILMDVHMPVMDGIEASEKIRAETPGGQNPWIIALTAAASVEDRKRCFSAGMNDYVTKPFKPQEIGKCLLGYIDFRDAEKAHL